MSLEDLLTTGLPMNRKERYFTGTVFPGIVCAENFACFDRFLELIPGCLPTTVDPTPDRANIQFFTEYGFMESVYGESTRARFPEPPTYRDTPDILIYIRSQRPLLIGLEAKVYDTPTEEALNEQIARQRRYVLDPLSAVLSLPPESIFLGALLPRALANRLSKPAFFVITWEAVHEAFTRGRPEDYFLATLRLALARYNDLVSRAPSFGANAEGKLSGEEILRRFRSGDTEFAVMGRAEGISGEPLREDLDSGRWRRQLYEVSRRPEPPNRNWFPIPDFVALIGAHDAP